MIKKILICGAIGLAVSEATIASYLLKRTLVRERASVKRTTKMAGTDWNTYIPDIKLKKQWLLKQKREVVYIESNDGLKLHGILFPKDNSKKMVICFHGYSSVGGISDFASMSKFYLDNNFNILMVDARAHGGSEGKYVGFGCLDRYDAMEWIKYVIRLLGKECEILLHGISMGGSTVLMSSGLELPENVKGIISDCAFTSPWDIFSDILKKVYHIPPFPIINIASKMSKKIAGYELNECNAIEEVEKAKVPILFIHGDNDTFVPCRMCYQIYDKCTSHKDILIVKGAGHAESYYKRSDLYEKKVREFIDECLSRKEVVVND